MSLTHTKFSRRTFLKAIAGTAVSASFAHSAFAQTPLRLSLIPLQDVLPLGFANTEGMFEAAGLPVELVGISSRRERSSALLSNNLDGVVTDISDLLFGRGNAGADLLITSTAFENIGDTRQLALLASGFSNVSDLDNLFTQINDQQRNSITVSRRTDFELVTDELLSSIGISVIPELHYADTDDLVNAATLLVGGSVLSAVLPEPLAIITEENELIDEAFLSRSVFNFESISLPPTIVVFRREVVEQREADVALFYEVYNQAIDDINNAARDTVREAAVVNSIELFLPGISREELPANFGENYDIPTFTTPGQLDEAAFNRVMSWATNKGYLFGDVDFNAAIDYRFIS